MTTAFEYIFAIVLLAIISALWPILKKWFKEMTLGWLKDSPKLKDLLDYEQLRELEMLRREFKLSDKEFLSVLLHSSALGTKIIRRDYEQYKKLYPERDEKRIIRDLLINDFKSNPDYHGADLEELVNEVVKNISNIYQLCNYVESLERKKNPDYFESSIGKYIEKIIGKESSDSSYHLQLSTETPINSEPMNYDYWINSGKRDTDIMKRIDCFRQAIAIDPNRPEAYYHRGYERTELELWELAIEDFNMYLSRNNENADVYFHRGFCHSKINHEKEAVDDYKKAAELGHEVAKQFLRNY